MFGTPPSQRRVALLVTCPSEAADDPSFMLRLAERGVEAVRINCAHDDPERWQRMINHLHVAAEATGRRMKIADRFTAGRRATPDLPRRGGA